MRQTEGTEAAPETPVHSKSDSSERHMRIAQLAYEKAQERGFESGREWEDWLAAEREVDESEGDSDISQASSVG